MISRTTVDFDSYYFLTHEAILVIHKVSYINGRLGPEIAIPAKLLHVISPFSNAIVSMERRECPLAPSQVAAGRFVRIYNRQQKGHFC